MSGARERQLTSGNVGEEIRSLTAQIAEMGLSITGKVGLPLLHALKRDRVGHGPYANVSFFEAANRIMSDLVILHGVRWLLETRSLPFESYRVEYGNEDRNGFDLIATNGESRLYGEAFNVAPSFFQTKKAGALKKLRIKGAEATHRVLLVNHDAFPAKYAPKREPGVYMFAVDVLTGEGRLVEPSLR